MGEGIEVDATLTRLEQRLGIEREAAALAPSDLPFRSVFDVLQDQPKQVEWLVDGLLAANGVSLLGAAPKVGKSTLARCLAAAVSLVDANWLGRETATGKVIHLALEESDRTVSDHYAKIGAYTPAILVPSGPLPRLSLDDRLTLIERAIREYEPKLLIIDPLFKFCRVQDGNSYSEVTNALDPIVGLARSESVHIMIVHHNRKSGGEHGDEFLGSTAIAGSADTLISMRRERDVRMYYAQGRDGVEVPETILTMDLNGWVSEAGTRQAAKHAIIKAAVWDYLADQDCPVTQRDIQAAVEGRGTTIKYSLDEMVAAGQVTQKQRHAHGGGYTYRVRLSHD